jgi:hypothetical protein
MKILSDSHLTYGGSPARHVDSKCEAGNKKSLAPCKIREVGIYKANKYINNETPLSFPAGNQSCPARASHPPEASLA